MMTRSLIAALVAASLSTVALGQGAGPPTPPPVSIFGATASLSISNATGSVAIPAGAASLSSVNILNDGASEIFVALGGAGVTATTGSFPLPPGYSVSTFIGTSTNVAGITASSTSTMRVTRTNGALTGSGGGSGGGGGGGGVVTQGTTPWVVALSPTPSLVNGSGVVPTQGGGVLSATNGGFQNVLQGNAVLSGTNGLFANILQGNAVLSQTNPVFSSITDGTNKAAVKPASTAALATDSAVVVALSPNNTPVGPGTAAAATRVTQGSDSPEIAVLGSTSDAPYTGTGNSTMSAGMRGLYAAMTAPPTLGSASGGWAPVGKIGITNASVTVKGTAGQLGFAYCDNNNNAWTYIQLFDAASPVLGTNVGFVPIPPNLAGGMTLSLVGLQFSNSIKVAATTTPNGSAAPATNTINCTFGSN